MSEPEPPPYFEYALLHTLHRIWETQFAALMVQAQTDEDKQAVQELIERQLKQEYTIPFPW